VVLASNGCLPARAQSIAETSAPNSAATKDKAEATKPAADEAQAKESTSSEPSHPSIEKKAEEVVRKVSSFYAGMKSFSGHMDVAMTLQGGDNTRTEVNSSITLRVSKPNKLYFSLESPRMNGTAVADGTTAYLYSSLVGGYLKQNAPQEMRELFEKPEF